MKEKAQTALSHTRTKCQACVLSPGAFSPENILFRVEGQGFCRPCLRPSQVVLADAVPSLLVTTVPLEGHESQGLGSDVGGELVSVGLQGSLRVSYSSCMLGVIVALKLKALCSSRQDRVTHASQTIWLGCHSQSL